MYVDGAERYEVPEAIASLALRACITSAQNKHRPFSVASKRNPAFTRFAVFGAKSFS